MSSQMENSLLDESEPAPQQTRNWRQRLRDNKDFLLRKPLTRFDALYPQRDEVEDDAFLDRLGEALTGNIVRKLRARPKRVFGIVEHVASHEVGLRALDQESLRELARELTRKLRREGLQDDLVAQTFALIRETADRIVGMRHFNSQLIGGWVMLQGMIAEMETGEGKTLTATLPACTAAMAGMPVHVITVNDYLVARDHELMQPVYAALGLTSATVTAEMTHEERQAAYACDVVYCSNKTVVFDYLRDRIVLGAQSDTLHLKLEKIYGGNESKLRIRKLLLRGLSFAIVDEADSVLADEAGTPLIISAEVASPDEAQLANQAMDMARQLVENVHYRVLKGERRIEMLEEGYQMAVDLSKPLGGVWNITLRREEMMSQALTALHLFKRDEQYLVRDGKIQVIDEFTGRVMADRSWSQGLHQLIELKEGCDITARREPLARISYQRFFRRYRHLSGMSGTASEVAGELGSIYGLGVVKIPTNRPSRRVVHADRVFETDDEKWDCVMERIAHHHARGAPILVGTRSVASSEQLSHRLHQLGLTHKVLNAKQDGEEADIVADAGHVGRITIATNMAGRGTDIKLREGAAELGGLHVIIAERHEAGRIDRQIAGRCARQGDPGNVEAILSLQDALMAPYQNSVSAFAMRHLVTRLQDKREQIYAKWIRHIQKRIEREQSRIRRNLLKADKQMGDILSFSGRAE
ncbi:preprotein translocase subunit SecA [uncultured Oxalicibacterium sp.]|uniref:preprotein translocase subunit SecA n=1 Tax=uncultured Oxalicibacterium sp. TaxID=1168540 RepID=UPI0025FA9BB3|nr:preprotein translocase subunit SecA [uncultured Oxalicibacterium sp.]